MTQFSRRQFLVGAGTAALGGTLALAGCSQSGGEEKAPATDGDSSVSSSADSCALGSGMGKHGHFNVEVVMKDDAIERIEVLDSRETPGLGDIAMEKLTTLILENQTLNVDTVTGATLSSMAFTNAVGEALEVLGQDSGEWEKREKAEYQAEAELSATYDVVVVGTGGAGFAAAISAANADKNVLLVEKLGVYGGSTSLSGGEMAAPGNWIQKGMGIEDTPEMLAQDMLKGGDNMGDPELVRVIAEGALDSAEWLTFEAGVSWKHNLMHFGGHSVNRSLIPISHSGSEMIVKLTDRAQNISNLTLVDCTQATELIKGATGIEGVKLTNTISGEEATINCKAVVLATGGFGANVEMRKEHNPNMDESFLSTDSVGATGDGLNMGQEIGASLVDMEYIQTYPVCDPGTGALLYVGDMRLEYHAIMINKEGVRFVEELDRRDVLSNAILDQTDSIGYMIFNQVGVDETLLLELHADEYENLESRGIIAKADTIEEACESFGIDPIALEETVAKWNEYCAKGSDPEFNYRGEMNPIEGGPYYIMSYVPAVHYTMGGLHINPSAEVLDESGAVIPGLYACGEAAGHKMGTNRLGSCSMSDIYTFGRVAGTNAAHYA